MNSDCTDSIGLQVRFEFGWKTNPDFQNPIGFSNYINLVLGIHFFQIVSLKKNYKNMIKRYIITLNPSLAKVSD